MIWGSQIVLGLSAVGFAVALAREWRDPKPQTTPAVVAQLALVILIALCLGLMIALARDPFLNFSPKPAALFNT